MIREHERVVLIVDLPDAGFIVGDVGIVVMIHGDHEGYELEIFSADGHMLNVVTVKADQVRPVKRNDMLHVRELIA